MNPTTSTRFNPFMPRFIRHFGLRAVGGKGGLDAASAAAMREVGCVYLSFLGGARRCSPTPSRTWRDGRLGRSRRALPAGEAARRGPRTAGGGDRRAGRACSTRWQQAARERLPDILHRSRCGAGRRTAVRGDRTIDTFVPPCLRNEHCGVMKAGAARDRRPPVHARGGQRPCPLSSNRRKTLGPPASGHVRPNSRLNHNRTRKEVPVTNIVCGVDLSSQTLDARIGPEGRVRVDRRRRRPELASFLPRRGAELVVMKATSGYEKLPSCCHGRQECPVDRQSSSGPPLAKAIGLLEKTIAWTPGSSPALRRSNASSGTAPARQPQQRLAAAVVVAPTDELRRSSSTGGPGRRCRRACVDRWHPGPAAHQDPPVRASISCND